MGKTLQRGSFSQYEPGISLLSYPSNQAEGDHVGHLVEIIRILFALMKLTVWWDT